MKLHRIDGLPIVDGRIGVADLYEWIIERDAGCAEYLADELNEYVESIPGKCKCHDRDTSFSCEVCRLLGRRGHMEGAE